MRILIFGSGAVGSLFGGLMAGKGHEVCFVGRRWIVEPIRQTGIRISGLWGEHSVGPQRAFESVDEIPPSERVFDLVYITTKTFATQEAIEAVAPILTDATLVISCQNGYGNCQMIAERIGWHRTLGARVMTGVEIDESANIQVTVHGDNVQLGHYLNEFPPAQIESIVMMMKEANILVDATEHLEETIWAKILYNAALNPLGALLGVRYGDLGEREETRGIMNRIIEEAFEVTQAQGIRQFWDSADAYRQAFYEKMVPMTAAHFPSMLRDLQRGRRTEIDALNGAILRLGQEKNIETPTNDLIVSLIHFQESRERHE